MAMKEKLPSGALDFVPSFSSSGSELAHGFGLSVGAFLSFVAIQWWSSWYPGAEPGGGGYVAQRMMSTRSEKESVWATLLFQIGHYCVRPWPWIIVGLCAMVLYAPEITNPELYETLSSSSYTTSGDFISNHNIDSNADIKSVRYFFEPRLGFVFAMRDFLPTGLVGLLLTAFIAAYLSTISTQVNWGASYLVNDFWIPVSKSENQKALVRTSRITSILVMIAGALITPMVTSISAVWAFIMQCGAGLGLVLILRWYWWRVNAWAEITATLAPLLGYTLSLLVLEPTYGLDYTDMNGPLYFTVVFTTISWIAVMFLTKAPSAESIKMFEQRVRPMGLWPKSIIQTSERNKSMKWMFGGWISMTCTIVFTLFTIGKLILLESTEALIFLAFTAMSVIALRFFLKKTNIFDRNSEME